MFEKSPTEYRPMFKLYEIQELENEIEAIKILCRDYPKS